MQAVIWDYGGVLVHMVDETPRRELVKRLGIRLDTLYRLVFESESARLASIGEISLSQHWQAVARLLHISDAELPGVLEQFWSADGLDQQLVAFIRSLRPRYRVGLLSNAWENLRDLLQNHWRIANLFDDLVISAEVKMVKPDVRIYRLAVERLGVPAEQAVFFDDLLQNVQAARQAGLHAFQYTGLTQVQADLAELEQSPE